METEKSKKCSRCGVEHPLHFFRKNKASRHGHVHTQYRACCGIEIEICSGKTLKSFPNLQEELESAFILSGLPAGYIVDGWGFQPLLIRILCGSMLQPLYEWAIWKTDPRGMRFWRCVAHFRPLTLIEIDIALGSRKPRLETVIRYFFHELGHFKAYLEHSKEFLNEKEAEKFASAMMKYWRENREKKELATVLRAGM